MTYHSNSNKNERREQRKNIEKEREKGKEKLIHLIDSKHLNFIEESKIKILQK